MPHAPRVVQVVVGPLAPRPGPVPDVAASCTTDQTTFQKVPRKNLCYGSSRKMFKTDFFWGGKIFSCPRSGHASRPTSQIPGPRPLAPRPGPVPDVAASCTTDQTTFQKVPGKHLWNGSYRKIVRSDVWGVGERCPCPGSGHAPGPTSPIPGTRPVPHAPGVAHVVVGPLAPRP